MRTFIFLILFCFSLNAYSASASKKLMYLLDQVESSQNLEQWHENKEKLESLGFKIWQKNRFNNDFCNEILGFSEDHFSTMAAWDLHSPTFCTLEIQSRFQHIRFHQIRTSDWDSVYMDWLGLETCTGEKPTRQTLGPSREVILDTTDGPRLVRGDLKKCEVAFTFDDGPHPKYTLELLNILKEQNVAANFFTVGRNVDRYPEITKAIAEYGHVVGNHSYSHKNFPKLSFSDALAEIKGGFRSLLRLWDYTTPFFRFPYGAMTKKTRAFNKKHHIAEFFWNMDTRDWGIKDPSELYKRVLSEIDREKRGILLFHDVHPQTIDVMPRVLIALRDAGYTTALFIPEDLIEDDVPGER